MEAPPLVTRIAWIVAVTLGLLAGGFAFHFPGSYGEPVWSVPAGIFGFVIGGLNGLLLGALAWMGLRLSRRDGLRVLAAMVVLIGGTHALNDGSSTQVPFVLIQGAAGLVALGSAAWILRERGPLALAIIGLAWAVGLVAAGWSGDVLGLPLTETPLGWSQDHAWDGLVTGLIWGSATAVIGLPETLRRHQRPEGSSPNVDLG
jgi:hypothetical protein